MTDPTTLAVVEGLLFRLLPEGPNGQQTAIAARVAAAYEAKYGVITKNDGAKMVKRVRTLLLKETLRELKEARR